jgi:hypothetical protein
VGPPSTAKFCRLLIDDYQHLKTAQQTTGTAAREQIITSYITFAPTLEAAAPSAIAGPVTRYEKALSPFLSALVAHNLNILLLPRATVTSLNAPAVQASAGVLISFSTNECHYDLQANSTPSNPHA